MKLTLVSAAAALLPLAAAHYSFDVLVVDGVESRPLEYIRSNTRQAKYNPTKWKNTRDDMTPDLPDFRCNKGAFTFAGQTKTAEVKAGSKLAIKLAVGATMQHPGPALVYMSKAPTTAQAYEGDGDWFKIFEEGVCRQDADFTKDAWCTWDKDRIEFTIPADTPDGEYLIRPEHIGLHGAHDGQAEFYYTCAQVKVVGGGNGTPGPMIQFPGGYKPTDPSFAFSLWSGYKPYTMPGPAVWTGGNTGGNTTEPSEPTEPAQPSQPANGGGNGTQPQPTPEPIPEPTPAPTQPGNNNGGNGDYDDDYNNGGNNGAQPQPQPTQPEVSEPGNSNNNNNNGGDKVCTRSYPPRRRHRRHARK